MDKVSDKETYPAIVHLLSHAEDTSWNRFHNFLIANSILILAWVTIYVSSVSLRMVPHVLIAICVLGIFSGIFWAALGYRGRKFVTKSFEMGKSMEEGIEGPKPITEFEKLRDTLRFGCCGSRNITIGGPVIFVGFYILLLVASLIR